LNRSLASTVAQAAGGSAHSWRGGWLQGVRYGGLGLPLAFVALPLYVVLPNHYATAYAMPLALLGALLLGARLVDAIADPFIGRWADALFDRSCRHAWQAAAIAAGVLAAGFAALFLPPARERGALLAWCAVMLVVTYLAYSVVTVIHQAWGARLGGDESQRARVVAWREALALVGVLLASVLPAVFGLGVMTIAFGLLLLAAMSLLAGAPQPRPSPRLATPARLTLPWSNPAFRALLAIYLLNGIASAIPATLVLFFIRDVLQAASFEAVFLMLYFAAGALSIPFWVRLVNRAGLEASWLTGMVLAIVVFIAATWLSAGDTLAYGVVCALSGVALGADLTMPGALLAGVIQRAGLTGRAEGSYFGWWNFATKLNLALAAGLALPLLQAFGYSPGTRGAAELSALTLAYCALPCALKLCAAALLFKQWRTTHPTSP
jgi:glycoside/pentoside/hexuronide:cation symporter, GPH family